MTPWLNKIRNNESYNPLPALQHDRHPEATNMNSKLNHIENWPELASQANWSASALAKKCGVSVRTLETHFLEKFGNCPRTWMAEKRQRLAIELLEAGCNVKETAAKLGYAHASTFCNKFPGLRKKAMQTAQAGRFCANS